MLFKRVVFFVIFIQCIIPTLEAMELADKDKEVLLSAYLEGYNLMLSPHVQRPFGGQLSERLGLLRKNGSIERTDVPSYAALFLLRQAFLDGRQAEKLGQPSEHRYYGRDKVCYVKAPPCFDDQTAKELVLRVKQVFYPMLIKDLEDFETPHSEQLPVGFIYDVFHAIRNNPLEGSSAVEK